MEANKSWFTGFANLQVGQEELLSTKRIVTKLFNKTTQNLANTNPNLHQTSENDQEQSDEEDENEEDEDDEGDDE